MFNKSKSILKHSKKYNIISSLCVPKDTQGIVFIDEQCSCTFNKTIRKKICKLISK